MKNEQMTPTPLARAIGLGSARHGFSHWYLQRLTAVLLIPLGLWFLFSLASLDDYSQSAVRAWLGSGLNAYWLGLFAIIALLHAKLGIEVVVEDYVHHRFWEVLLKVLLTLALVLATALVVLSIITLVRGA
jgi:succinate dehydrogenase / fumarate reductase membrane anchor subunit